MANPQPPISIFWFRRDLRLRDNHGLFKALERGLPVLPLFIFDENILNTLENKTDARVQFIHDQLSRISDQLKKKKSTLLVLYGTPEKVFKDLINHYHITSVYTNHDYEPYARQRDQLIGNILQKAGISFHTYKDQVIFEKNEIVTGAGSPYKVFTAYKRTWLNMLSEDLIRGFPDGICYENFLSMPPANIPSLQELGFEKSSIQIPEPNLDSDLLKTYDKTRNRLSLDTSRIGIYLRYGVLSVRKAVEIAMEQSNTWLSELIWREFFMMILYNHPYVVDNAYKAQFNNIQWRNNEEDFEKWCEGMTGYPIVDAGMRQLNKTGFMHNRARMITASFLTKHLLIDCKWGEAYFAEKLLDYELASNNGNWQWVAGTGADAQPYFRVFNPCTQAVKFDKEYIYIKKWIPEIGTQQYPEPLVDHKTARERALQVFKSASVP